MEHTQRASTPPAPARQPLRSRPATFRGARPRRPRPVAAGLARTALNVVAVLVAYYALPLTRAFGWQTIITLAGGLVAIGLLVAWQIRVIVQSPYPALRAVETLALAVPLFLVLFAAVYVILDHSESGAFSESLSRTDGLYFVVTVFATVGFGDITPVSQVARLLVTVQMVGDLLLIGLVIRSVLFAVQRGRDSARRPPPAD